MNYTNRRKRPKKIRSLTIFISFSIAVVLIYSIVEFIFSIKYGISHEGLTTGIFAFFGTELAGCTLIRIFKVMKIGENE